MDFDDFEVNEEQLELAMEKHERQLQEDEKPVVADNDCGDVCKI